MAANYRWSSTGAEHRRLVLETVMADEQERKLRDVDIIFESSHSDPTAETCLSHGENVKGKEVQVGSEEGHARQVGSPSWQGLRLQPPDGATTIGLKLEDKT